MLPERNASDAILSGEVIVKVLRIASGRNLGPGVYSVTTNNIAREGSTHNIKGLKEFQELDKFTKRKESSMHQKTKEVKKLVSSFYESQRSSFIQIFNEETKKVNGPGFRARPNTQLSQNKRGQARYNISPNESEKQICNQTTTTAGESKEAGRSGQRKSLSVKNIEKIRQIIRESEQTQGLRAKNTSVSSFALPSLSTANEQKEHSAVPTTAPHSESR